LAASITIASSVTIREIRPGKLRRYHKIETASRVRGRIEKVLDAAKAKGFREGENPARWRGHLDHLLPRPSKLSRGHHAAMPYEEVAAFIAKLRERDATSALALELCILTAARSGEILGMRWSEIDFDKKIWTVPAARMKAGREHRVPLASRAVEMLRQLEKVNTGEFVFPGQARNKPLSNMAMEMVLRRMKIEDATVHGFRSSFRDWAGNVSSAPREVVETALAHVIGDKAEQAYRRRDVLDEAGLDLDREGVTGCRGREQRTRGLRVICRPLPCDRRARRHHLEASALAAWTLRAVRIDGNVADLARGAA